MKKVRNGVPVLALALERDHRVRDEEDSSERTSAK